MSGLLADQLNGLPAPLPPGEAIVWQGRPDAGRLLQEAFHARAVAFYFVVLSAAGLLMGSVTGALLTVGAGAICLGVLAMLARASARTSVYTLTDRRLVLRVGMALPMHFNLPLKQVEAADLRLAADGSGDIALRLAGNGRIAWALLWPHVRPWRTRNPEPMLRAVPDAETVARLLHQCCAALVEVEADAPAPVQARPVRRPARIAAQPAGVAA
ncbi:photosynthetic complex putative assembly protein PuhB [Sphingomonas glaciei]|uniref:Photosynthetic complex putative assembly protein PuhB n=1 Tax=Sphingomonas glaciei TaxID=2938948 RepID=A0ABY5MW27_9SPHN|nr:photosynthetic complex putative assembly protein PuhB [Sphingomonas glaciei]UUR07965.1 photosynthetic complex putative assembly protein PuhB [Sphingomonas glaciei]